MSDPKNLIRYSEIFYSIQGEGEYTGVPTAWLRFFLCNLQCNGFGQKDPTDPETYELPYQDFDPQTVNRVEDLPVWHTGCDSSYSWAKKYKHLTYADEVSVACDKIQQSLTTDTNPQGTFLHPHSHVEQHMCFTGGEPLLPHGQRGIVNIVEEMKNRTGGVLTNGVTKGSNVPEYITIETNGTKFLQPHFEEFFYNRGCYSGELFFSISPKLWTVAGEKDRVLPEVIKQYHHLSKKGQLKFVLGPKTEQWEELERAIETLRDSGIEYPVWIMPVGADEEMQAETAGGVAEMAFRRGYNVSARVHVDLWGNKIGV